MNDIRKRPVADLPAPATPEQPNSARDAKLIEIRLMLPRLQVLGILKIMATRAQTLRRRQKIGLIVAAVTVIVAGTFIKSHSSDSNTGSPKQQNPLDMIEKGTPDYATLVPQDSRVVWYRITPKDRNAVYAYADTISGVQVRVSQQPLPDEFLNDTDNKIRNIAISENATKTISAAGTKIYVGASSKGTQPAIFAKDKLLITMRAAAPIDDDDWKTYINSLR